MIEKHRAAREFINQVDETEAKDLFEAAVAAEDDQIRQLVTVKPRTLAGLAAFATYVADYPPLSDCSEDALQAVVTIVETLRDILAI